MIRIGYLEQSKSQDSNVSANRKKERKKQARKERYRSLLILFKYFAATAAITVYL